MTLRTRPHALDVASAKDDHPRLAPWADSSAKEFWRQVDLAKSMCAHADLIPKDGPTRRYLDIMCAATEVTADAAKMLVYEHFMCLPSHVRESVYNELDVMEKLVDLREQIAKNEEGASKAWSEFDRALPEFQDKWREVVRRSKLVPLPPTINTPNNLEALLMANAYVMEPMAHFSVDDDCQQAAHEAALTLVEHMAVRTPALHKLVLKSDAAFKSVSTDAISAAHFFSVAWMHSGFAKLEIGHKLAASLALTDVPDDIEVRAPWKAWSLVVPPGLFGDEGVARVWCEGTQVRFVVGETGTIVGPITQEVLRVGLSGKVGPSHGRATMAAIDSLVRGCCLALSNPDDYRKHKTSSTSSKPKRERSGEPDFSATRFLLSAPITIDMRAHLLDVLHGKRHGGGGSPTVQFLVRGHWRNQAHGPGRALRKQIRIEPFWKGPEEARVLLRNYKTKEDE